MANARGRAESVLEGDWLCRIGQILLALGFLVLLGNAVRRNWPGVGLSVAGMAAALLEWTLARLRWSVVERGGAANRSSTNLLIMILVVTSVFCIATGVVVRA